jgi:selenocysteine lyase/cysteine desulfurase
MQCAETFATLLGAPPGSIGLTASVSAAVGSVLSALDFTERRKVVTSVLDFPTVPDILLAYAHQGILELEVLPEDRGDIPLDFYERAIDARTRLVCISTASYASGTRLPVAQVVELAHARGALCLVDAYQTLGALKFNIAQLQPDFLVTGALKYLLGASGLGFLFVAPQLTDALTPRDIGWMAAANPFGTSFDRLEYAAGAARFQGGTFNISGCYAACAALALLLQLSAEAIQERVLNLSRRFTDGLLALGVEPRGPAKAQKLGPMVAVPMHGDSNELQERLRRDERVITAARGQALRFAFHFYNDDSDVDACLDVVRRNLNPADAAGFVQRPLD